MSYIVAPVIAGKPYQIRAVRVISAEACSIVLRRDDSATLYDGAGDHVEIDLGGTSEHRRLSDALAAGRDLLAETNQMLPIGEGSLLEATPSHR